MAILEIDNLEVDARNTALNRRVYFYRWLDDDNLVLQLADTANFRAMGLYHLDRQTLKESLLAPKGRSRVSQRNQEAGYWLKPWTYIGADPDRRLIYALGYQEHAQERALFSFSYPVGAETLVERPPPGRVSRWMADHRGQVRFRVDLMPARAGELLRNEDPFEYWIRSDHSAPWSRLIFDRDVLVDLHPSAEGTDRKKAGYVFINRPTRGEVLEVELDQDQAQSLPSDPVYDVHASSRPVFKSGDNRLLGIYWDADKPRSHWFDPQFSAVQRMLDGNLGPTFNEVVSLDQRGNRALVLAYSDRMPTSYYLFDREQRELRFLLHTQPLVKPEEMSEMRPIQFATADGSTVYGYLTAQSFDRPRPLVLLIHGGPRTRDLWSWNWEGQFLANRGYAVLQVNYRGSIGYGSDYALSSITAIRRAFEEDLLAGIDWVVAQGWADPNRVAACGSSFGAYAALSMAAFHPQRIHAAVGRSGVYDWKRAVQSKERETIGRYFWESFAGNPQRDRDALRDLDLLSQAHRLRCPVLLVHGEKDLVVPDRQSKLMAGALRKDGAQVETVFYRNESHGILQTANRIDYLRRLEDFLARHLPAP